MKKAALLLGWLACFAFAKAKDIDSLYQVFERGRGEAAYRAAVVIDEALGREPNFDADTDKDEIQQKLLRTMILYFYNNNDFQHVVQYSEVGIEHYAQIGDLFNEAGGAVLKQLMEAGVNGFMSKSVGPDEITSVLRSVMAGNDCTDEAHLRIKSDLKDDYETMKSLSHREIELISLCASGLNTKQIAEEMCVTPHSIENMKSSLFGKIGVKSINELILYAFRVGLVS